MAGLLDSDWVKFLAAPRAYYRDKAAQQSADQFGGLLGTLEQQGPANPQDPGGLLAPRQPDAQFWLKAATIPGYEGLAGQQLGIETQGQQALGRQMQGQDWSTQNMTLAQQQAQQLARETAIRNYGIAQADLQRKQAGTAASIGASNASALNSGVTAQLNNERLLGERTKNQNLAGPLYGQLPPAERLQATQDLYNNDTWAMAASDVADWADKRGPGAAIPVAGTSEADAWNTEWQSSAKPAFMKILNTGVLQGKEAEELAGIIGQPADMILTRSQLNVIRTVSQKVQDLRENAYKSMGLKAPPLKRGGSAAARAMSGGQPVGKVTPVMDFDTGAPTTPTIWNPVQRSP